MTLGVHSIGTGWIFFQMLMTSALELLKQYSCHFCASLLHELVSDLVAHVILYREITHVELGFHSQECIVTCFVQFIISYEVPSEKLLRF